MLPVVIALAATLVKAAGGLLALALVRPWGRAVPRRWLLAGSAVASAVLVVYGGLNVLLGALVLSGVIHPFGLSCESICRPGPRFLAPASGAGLICLAWARGRGFTDPGGQRVPSLNHRKGMATTIVETRAITGGAGHPRGRAPRGCARPIGGLLGVREFPATATGYGRLLSWLGGFGTVCLVGIEGTGSYGAGLARYITAARVRVVEADFSDRQAPGLSHGH